MEFCPYFVHFFKSDLNNRGYRRCHGILLRDSSIVKIVVSLTRGIHSVLGFHMHFSIWGYIQCKRNARNCTDV